MAAINFIRGHGPLLHTKKLNRANSAAPVS